MMPILTPDGDISQKQLDQAAAQEFAQKNQIKKVQVIETMDQTHGMNIIVDTLPVGLDVESVKHIGVCNLEEHAHEITPAQRTLYTKLLNSYTGGNIARVRSAKRQAIDPVNIGTLTYNVEDDVTPELITELVAQAAIIAATAANRDMEDDILPEDITDIYTHKIDPNGTGHVDDIFPKFEELALAQNFTTKQTWSNILGKESANDIGKAANDLMHANDLDILCIVGDGQNSDGAGEAASGDPSLSREYKKIYINIDRHTNGSIDTLSSVNTLAHEIGHLFGLNHEYDPEIDAARGQGGWKYKDRYAEIDTENEMHSLMSSGTNMARFLRYSDTFNTIRSESNGKGWVEEMIEQGHLSKSTSVAEISDYVEDIKIVPNPTSGRFDIDLSGHTDKIGRIEDAFIINAVGEAVGYPAIQGNIISADLSGYPDGMYFVRYKTDKDIGGISKIIKN